MENTCIFCRIAAGEIPSHTVYEDDMFRAILDINPASKGHTLILPKKHCKNLYELEEEAVSKVFVLAKKLSRQLTEALACDGIHILQNNGEAAGQTVFHFHMHLIPRYEGDDVGLALHSEKNVPQYHLEEVKTMVLKSLQSGKR